MGITAQIIALIILLFWAGYFSASETALFSLSRTRIKAYQTDPNPRKRLIARLLSQPRDLLVTIFMLNTLTNILIQNVSSNMFAQYGSWILKVGLPLTLTLVVGEVIPKSLGLQNNISLSYALAPVINFLQNIIEPIRKAIISVTYPISRIMFFFLKKEGSISKEELQHVLKTSEAHGILHKDEAELVWGYLNLQDATVKEIMRPRQEILYYSIEEPLTKLTYLFVDQECSRIPICRKSLENLEGIMSVKKFFLERDQIDSPESLLHYTSKPFFIPENTLAKILLRRLDEQGEEIAIVVDEYGSISGLITREDILEVVIGPIEDLRDQENLYTKQSENEIIANGKLELSDFNRIFDAELYSDNVLTLGGWLIEKLGEIPKSGTKFETDDFLFHVLASDPTHIRRIYVRRKKPKLTK